jgi:hypothetical protein
MTPDAVILINGDHGFRLDDMHYHPTQEELEAPAPQPPFDPLFAVRGTGKEAGVHDGLSLLPERFREAFLGPLSNPLE